MKSMAGKSRLRQSGNAATAALSAAGVVGLVALGNHGKEFDTRQTTYESREQCLEDWDRPDDCTVAPATHGTGTYYLGPRYYWDPERGHPVVVEPSGVERMVLGSRVGPAGSSFGRTASVGSFARGGFGGIGRGFSAGGRGG